MTDIVERLRANQCKERQGGCGSMTACPCADADDASHEIQRLRGSLERLKKRERDADGLLTDIEEYFDAYADGDEDGPNREAVLMQRCADWLGPVPDLASKRAALSETEGRYR